MQRAEVARYHTSVGRVGERSAEAPASTDGANLKLQGQSLTLTPVASSGWFGDVFISSKISGQLSPNCTANHAKYTERNPRYPVNCRKINRSEERRVGKECRYRRWREQ